MKEVRIEEFQYKSDPLSIHLKVEDGANKTLEIYGPEGSYISANDENADYAVFVMKNFIEQYGHKFPEPKRELID